MFWFVFIICLAGLYWGAEFLIRGASSIALHLKVSQMFIGITIVAFGTSLPELIVSMLSAVSNEGNLAVGNVVGSNICNIGLILGLSAIISPLNIQRNSVKKDVPLLIFITVVCCLFLWNQMLSRFEGVLLFSGFILFIFFSLRADRNERTDSGNGPSIISKRKNAIWFDIFNITLGISILIFSARAFIWSSLGIAKDLGVPDAVIALTLVAVGTSLPELATSAVAAFKGNSDIAVGNIVGSNIFNILAILGLSSIVRPIRSEGISWMDLSVMLFFAILILPFVRTRFKLERWEGIILFLFYVLYIVKMV